MTREDIIKAAFRVWGRELYHSTSLTQLARDLGVTKPALYRHFPNKEALTESMYEWFFDDYTAGIKPDYDRALETGDPVECMMIMVRAITRYYCLNVNAFLFALIRVYGCRDHGNISAKLEKRGIDMKKLRYPGPRYSEGDIPYPSLLQLVILTLIFWVAYYHKDYFEAVKRGSKGTPVFCGIDSSSEETADELVVLVEEKIRGGLGFDKDRVDALNYEELEERIAAFVPGSFEDDWLYHAVAGAVAEAGPWDVSMEMVARRSGLSKSGLYSHFKSKQDMIRQFFLTEFKRIIASADMGKSQSTAPEEQFYMVIIAIADYLRANPEILLAFDRIRIRNLDLGSTEQPLFYQVFSGIRAKVFSGEFDANRSGTPEPRLREQISQWILFLIINTLMRWPGEGPPSDKFFHFPFSHAQEGPDNRSRFVGIKNSSFRILYRFIVLGIHGFAEGGIDP
jgi:AcrR family transcriptional regulator